MKRKSKLTSLINHHKQFTDLIKRVEDAIDTVDNFNSFKLLFFINETEEKIVKSCCEHFSNISYTLISKITNSEKKFLIIHHANDSGDFQEATTLFKVMYKQKFTTIEHRDVLGTLMSLKLNRNLLGDIVVVDSAVYLEIAQSLAQYLIDNLTSIKKSKVELKAIKHSITRKQEYLKQQTIIKSFRLDSVISAITKLSRSETKDLVLSGSVKLNHIVFSDFSHLCQDGDIVSIKGYGRYKLGIDSTKSTKKHNFFLEYHKYL